MIEQNTQGQELNVTQKALVAVKSLRKKLETLQQRNNEPLAVIGMACRFPGGVFTPEDFWELLIQKKDAITSIPEDRWNIADFYDPDPTTPGKMYVKQGGFIDSPYHFDAALFGLSKRETQSMDPQQRLLLELSWQALERAGIAPRQGEGRQRTGLFIGMATNDYSRFHINSSQVDAIDIYSFTGCAPSIASGRVSQLLDLGGPTLTIDTACSSSIVALHLARQSILTGECDVALAGGVNLMLSPENTIYFCKTSALSTDSRCKTFDESANGYVRSEGGGIVVLKRLSKAIKDKNPVLAVLQGSAINHDGEGIGLTAPNGESQQRLIRAALDNAGVKPEDIGFVETHGTGTPLGDPIELQALGKVLQTAKRPIAIGACKSNIGHLEAAAGVAGIIKSVLSLQNKTLAPNIHFKQPSSYIPWQRLPFRVVQEAEHWEAINGKRFAGVSSFGFSGTNSHAILTEAPERNIAQPANNSKTRLLTLSGLSPSRLQQSVADMQAYLSTRPDIDLDALCLTANSGRYHFNHRIAIAFDSYSELLKSLSALEQQQSPDNIKTAFIKHIKDKPSTAILLHGFADTHAKAHQYLYDYVKVFRNASDHCAEIFKNRHSIDVRHLHDDLNPAHGFLLEYAGYPIQFSFYYAWLTLLKSWINDVDYYVCDGAGALAAACCARHITPEEAVDICAGFIKGKSASLAEKKSAGDNTLPTCIIGGTVASGTRSFDFWYDTFTKPVSHERQLTALTGKAPAIIIDCGQDTAEPAAASTNINPFTASQNIDGGLREMLATLYCGGLAINWDNCYHDNAVQKLILPTTPFERSEYRLDAPKVHGSRSLPSPNTSIGKQHPLLGLRIVSPLIKEICFQQYLRPGQVPFLLDHGFLNKVVVPATAYLETIAAALQTVNPGKAIHLLDVNYHAGLYLPDNRDIHIQLVISGDKNQRVEIFSAVEHPEDAGQPLQWTLHCSAEVSMENGMDAMQASAKHDSRHLPGMLQNGAALENFYPGLNAYGYLFGPAHQGITRIVRTGESSTLALAECHATVQHEFDEYYFHPAHLDSCCHAILALLPQDDADSIFITVGKEKVHFFSKAESTVLVKAEVTEKTASSVKADLSIFNTGGDCLALIEGYTMKRVRRAMLQEAGKQPETQHRYDQWLYKTAWKIADLPKADTATLQSSRWIICGAAAAENLALARQISAALKSAGGDVVFVDREEIGLRIKELCNENSGGLRGIIHLDVENIRPAETGSDVLLNKSTQSGFFYLSDIVKNLPVLNKPVSLLCITKGVQQVTGSEAPLNFNHSSVWGLGRSILLEQPNVNFINLDLCASFPFANTGPLLDILCQPYSEDQFAFRDGQVYVNRLVSLHEQAQTPDHSEHQLNLPAADGFKLAISEQGSIENLYYKTEQRSDLESDEVEIEVSAAALNFYDVVTALDLIDTSIVNGKENDECRFGLDAVGRISRVGSNVNEYRPGQWVMSFAAGAFARYLKANKNCVTAKPAHFGLYESVTIPTAFLTAYYALHRLAKIKRGDKVLIHAAAGGVGIAAINLAKIAGAEIFATASKPKWELLKSMGIKHIYNSRTLEFADRILHDTGGAGVDIILNSFIGDYIAKNVDILKPGGQFVEIGEREILTREDLAKFDKSFHYRPFTLFEISRDHPLEIKAMFDHMQALWRTETFDGIPYQVFAAEDIKQGFRMMQQGLHKGKLLVSFEKHLAESKPVKPLCNPQTALLLTGGMGGIGLATAQWLSTQSVGAIYLMGRSNPDEQTQAAIGQLRTAGATVEYLRGDISKQEDVAAVLKAIDVKGIPLKGILHAAGVMHNQLIALEPVEDAQAVLAAKTLGALHLHNLTIEKDLDHFICFSSMTSFLGAAGAGSYAAGNAFLDSLMAYRKQLGLPALSINWGAWKDVGMLTRLNTAAKDYWSSNGIQALSNATALAVFDAILGETQSQVAILPAEWNVWKQQYARLPSVLKDISDATKGLQQSPDSVEQNTDSQQHGFLTGSEIPVLLSNSIRKILRLGENEVIESEQSFQEMGLDSLMSVELVNMLSKALNTKLSKTILFSYSNINALAQHLQTHFAAQPVMTDTVSTTDKPNIISSQHITTVVTAHLKSVLRLDATTAIDENELFSEMGVDSLISVEFRNLLSKALQVQLSSTVMFNYPTLKLLTEYLHHLINPAPTQGEEIKDNDRVVAAGSETADDPSLERIRALLDEKILVNET